MIQRARTEIHPQDLAMLEGIDLIIRRGKISDWRLRTQLQDDYAALLSSGLTVTASEQPRDSPPELYAICRSLAGRFDDFASLCESIEGRWSKERPFGLEVPLLTTTLQGIYVGNLLDVIDTRIGLAPTPLYPVHGLCIGTQLAMVTFDVVG